MNWKGCEGILASFKVIFQNLPEGTERNYGKPSDSRSAGFKLETPEFEAGVQIT
jgi:hypothetical protein